MNQELHLIVDVNSFQCDQFLRYWAFQFERTIRNTGFNLIWELDEESLKQFMSVK